MSLNHTNFKMVDARLKIEKHTGRRRKSKIFVFVEADTMSADALYDLDQKEYRKLTRRAARMLLDQHKDFRAYRGCKLRFSAKAGCACGCSPGYILQHDDGMDADVYLTVEVELNRATLSPDHLPDEERPYEWVEAETSEQCPELDASTMAMPIAEFKEHMKDCGWTMDADFNLHDPNVRYPYPIGCVDFENGVATLFLNPVIA